MLTVRGGYHGDTFAPMSVCDPVGGMHSLFTGVLPEQVFAPRPPAGVDLPDDDPAMVAWERGDPGAVRRARRRARRRSSSSRCCRAPAGCTSTARTCRARAARRWPDEHGALLIFDEIATGFGRTGTLCSRPTAAGVVPDIMCVGKALTGGYLTLAAMLCTARGRRGSSAAELRRADARPDLHGQPAGLLGRARQPRPAGDERLARRRSLGSAGRARAPGSEPAARARLASPTCASSARSASSSCASRSTSPRSTEAAIERGRLAAAVPRPRLHDAAVRHRRATTWPRICDAIVGAVAEVHG